MSRSRNNRLGRNDPCPCGSGKKHKNCCLADSPPKPLPDANLVQEHAEALERQRLKLQGHGKPIISAKTATARTVTVGGITYSSTKWATFHDFLRFYIDEVLKGNWSAVEWTKPRGQRHSLLNWNEDFNAMLKAKLPSGGIGSAPMSTLSAAYLGLAYNLYVISHNNGRVHAELIRRLQQPDHFLGAWYEAFVTGAMIRAGFDIELEDEADTTTSHCEFTTTYRKTGQKYSVEAKMRHSQKPKPILTNLLGDALAKRALHPRIVFLEINCLHDGTAAAALNIVRSVADDLAAREESFQVDRQPAPPAYLFLTNQPPGSIETPYLFAGSMKGFRMPDFKIENGDLRNALAWRERHRAMLDLSESLEKHIHVPSTFDGELPEVAFTSVAENRLLAGNRLRIPTPEGEFVGELMSGCVATDRKTAMCALRLDDGRNVFVEIPLTDEEMSAYHASPETFFGVITGPPGKIDHPFKYYDWILGTHGHNPREHFLDNLMRNDPDIDHLRTLSHEDILKEFAYRSTLGFMKTTGIAGNGLL